jgi:hypothetical protein
VSANICVCHLFVELYEEIQCYKTQHYYTLQVVPLRGYLAGRNCGRYHASDPSLYRRPSKKHIHNFPNATVTADYMGDTFPPRGLRQQTPFQSSPTLPLAYQPQPQTPDFSRPPNERISEPIHTTNDKGTPRESVLKIQELKRLLYRYPQCYSNPDVVLKCAAFYSVNGDNSLLDEWLERLRMIDYSKH